MLNTILQVAGFVGALVLLAIFYATGNHSAWPALFTAAFATHFAGDWITSFLKPITVGGFSLKENFFPRPFTGWVGLMLSFAAFFFLLSGHSQIGAGLGFFGLALVGTSLVWNLIYP